jgi:hypothetical protein
MARDGFLTLSPASVGVVYSGAKHNPATWANSLISKTFGVLAR